MSHLPIISQPGNMLDTAIDIASGLGRRKNLALETRINRETAVLNLASKVVDVVGEVVVERERQATLDAQARRHCAIVRSECQHKAEIREFATAFTDRMTDAQFNQVFNAYFSTPVEVGP